MFKKNRIHYTLMKKFEYMLEGVYWRKLRLAARICQILAASLKFLQYTRNFVWVQEFDTFLLQASTFFSILEFFYECIGSLIKKFSHHLALPLTYGSVKGSAIELFTCRNMKNTIITSLKTWEDITFVLKLLNRLSCTYRKIKITARMMR